MNLALHEIKEVTATENMPCDACGFFKSYYWAIPDIMVRIKYIHDLFRIRHMKIQPTETYLNITLIDQDTGEQLEMNVKKGLHKLNLTRSIYPLYLSKILMLF